MITMKKQIPHYTTLILCFLLVGNVYGQGVATEAAASGNHAPWPHCNKYSTADRILATQSADVPISYFDPALPTHSWTAPSEWNPIGIISFVQRFTLTSDSGFVDSARIVFDSISGDSIAVFLDPDTIIQTSLGYFHLDKTVFDNTVSSFGIAVIYPALLNGLRTVTVAFPHVQVPKNFHIGLGPSSSATAFTASYSVRGDSEATRPRTTDNCRSSFVGEDLTTGQSEAGVIDSNLTPAGDIRPLFSNLYITAYVLSSPANVATNAALSSSELVFPNPASDRLYVSMADGARINGLEIRDLLGHPALVSNGDIRSLDVSHLLPGHYEAVINSSLGITVSPFVIQR
jgi:hypothetical protein